MSVYFAKVGRYIKVGHSRNPERRVANLFKSATRYARPADCNTSDPRELLATIPGGLGEERACHVALIDFAAGGEFFVDEPPVRQFIADVQEGRFAHVPRHEGPYEPPSDITDEEQAHLQSVINGMWEAMRPEVAPAPRRRRRAS